MDGWKIEIVCTEKFVVQICFPWEKGEFLRAVDKKFGPVHVWVNEYQRLR